MTVAVVGAGVTGLAAAYELVRAGAEVVVLESERRPGGVIVTDHPAPGWVVEGGPDSVLAADPVIPAIAKELGIADRLVGQSASGSFLWNGSALSLLSEGEAAKLLGIEASITDLAPGFTTFAGGMQELVDALMKVVGHTVRYRVGVTSLHPAQGAYRLSATGGTSLVSEAVIVTLPTYAAARLMRGIDGEVADLLQEIRYLPSLSVSLAYRRDQIGAGLDGTGFVVQPGVELALRACTFSSNKFAGRAPAGHVLVRAFLMPVERPERVAHECLAPILPITGAPLWARVFEWPKGLPRPGGNHRARLQEIGDRLAAHRGLVLAGAGLEAPSVSACVASGRKAARRVLEQVRK